MKKLGRLNRLVLLLTLMLSACGGDRDGMRQVEEEIAAVEAEVGAITEIDCPLAVAGETEGETYSCGVYTVPVDYAEPDGATLNLAYMILHANDPNPLPDPIVYLAGGPGQSSLLAAGGTLYGDLRQQRDLIFPAQRGTLFAGRLALEECVALLSEQMDRGELEAFVEEASADAKPDRSLPYDDYLAAYGETVGRINGRCHAAFSAAGFDPTQFTTANSTNDLAGLLAALGYESFNLHGTSYGTRLALETLRRHPEANIRSVVLDSPVAPTEKRLAALASAVHDSVLRVFNDCADDTACAAAFPDLTARTAALMSRLAQRPLVAGEETIGPDELRAQLVDLGNTRANYLPRMVAELEAGDATTYLALLNGEIGTERPEGSLTSPAVDRLLQQISMAGTTADNPFAGLQTVANVLAGAQEENPREAMKALAEENLADAESLPDILDGIDELTPDDLQTLQGFTAGIGQAVDEAEVQRRQEATARNNAQFLLSGIVCLEQLPFEDAEAAVALRDELPIPALAASDAFLATEVGNCTDYPMGDFDPTYGEPVTSDVPILILQGEFDTRTPPANGRVLAEQLANATLVIVPQAGHETWGSGGCVSQIGISFLRNPEETPDLSCLEQRREQFSLPGEPLTPYEGAGGAETPAGLAGKADALLVSTLGNRSYTGLFPDRAIQLTDGIGRYEEPDSAATPYVRLLDQVIASGDLDGDGTMDAAILLEDHSAGSGTFLFLVVVLDALGRPSQAEPLMVGDRVQAKDLAIAGAEISAELIAQGPGDELCCASWNVRREYALQEGQIVETSSEEIGQVSLSELDDTRWRLVALTFEGEPVPPETGATLQFSDGQVSGFAGCNTYEGEVASGPAGLFNLAVGPLSATTTTCAEAIMLQETAFLARLSDAVSWWIDGGRLALVYSTADGGSDSLYFEAAPSAVLN